MNLIRYNPANLSAWSPFSRASTLREEMNRLLESFWPEAAREEDLFGGWAPALDVYQDKDAVTVKAELPGMKKEEIEISLHQGTLTISGERKQEEERKDADSFRRERFFGKFQRSLTLPTAVDASKVKASYKDGVLTVTLPKAEEAKPKQIDVKID